jgi:hypothetical protein
VCFEILAPTNQDFIKTNLNHCSSEPGLEMHCLILRSMCKCRFPNEAHGKETTRASIECNSPGATACGCETARESLSPGENRCPRNSPSAKSANGCNRGGHARHRGFIPNPMALQSGEAPLCWQWVRAYPPNCAIPARNSRPLKIRHCVVGEARYLTRNCDHLRQNQVGESSINLLPYHRPRDQCLDIPLEVILSQGILRFNSPFNSPAKTANIEVQEPKRNSFR